MCTPVKDDMQMYTIILYSSIGHNNNARNTGLKTWPRFNHNLQQSATFDHIIKKTAITAGLCRNTNGQSNIDSSENEVVELL